MKRTPSIALVFVICIFLTTTIVSSTVEALPLPRWCIRLFSMIKQTVLEEDEPVVFKTADQIAIRASLQEALDNPFLERQVLDQFGGGEGTKQFLSLRDKVLEFFRVDNFTITKTVTRSEAIGVFGVLAMSLKYDLRNMTSFRKEWLGAASLLQSGVGSSEILYLSQGVLRATFSIKEDQVTYFIMNGSLSNLDSEILKRSGVNGVILDHP